MAETVEAAAVAEAKQPHTGWSKDKLVKMGCALADHLVRLEADEEELAISREAFNRVVRDIAGSYARDLKFDGSGLTMLQNLSETYMAEFFEDRRAVDDCSGHR